MVEVELEPRGGHQGEFGVYLGKLALAGLALEAEIGGDVEDGEVAGAVGGIARLEDVVEREAESVGAAEIVDIARVAETDRSHHHEAIYWANREREKGEAIKTRKR